MTRKKLRTVIKSVTGIYAVCALVGIVIRVYDTTEELKYYSTFTDLIPIIFAVPLGYLGFCFQRRQSFMDSLKDLWKNMIIAVNEAIQYTHNQENTQQEYGRVLTKLSEVIDELRGVYKNIGETESRVGLFPFEPIKSIRTEVEKLGFGLIDKTKSKEVRKVIIGNWKSIRQEFLHEFDRHEPTKSVSPYEL